MDFEYDPQNPATWVARRPPSKPEWFQEELIRIAGKNRHGQPNLRIVWGGSEMSDRMEKPMLKYSVGLAPEKVQGWNYLEDGEWKFTDDLAKVPEGLMVAPATKTEELGLLRWVIEKWVSPEELEANQRFQNRYLPGDMTPVLRNFPRQGVYDCFLIVQNLEGKFRTVDRDILEFITLKWRFEQKPFYEREAVLAEQEAREAAERKKKDDELWEAAWNFDLRLDPEEKERRAEYWAKHHDYTNEQGVHIRR